MPTQHVYFTDDVYSKIRQEENASRLICRLLREHYAQEEKTEMTIEQMKLRLAEIQIEKRAEAEKIALKATQTPLE